MKWYFASNGQSKDFFPLIKAAVTSALKNTTLEPNFIYDGEENEFTKWLREKGVNIIPHRISFYEKLKNHYDERVLKIATGAFLRCDIPIIEKEDKFVLYTDCDVLFLKDFSIDIEPEYFACSTQFSKTNYENFNTGVMLINVEKFRESYQDFKSFITENLSSLPDFDQTAYQKFYKNKNTKLPIIYNHKPYWGIDKNAVILHFHGPKPIHFTSEQDLKNFPGIYYRLYKKKPKAYEYYLNLFKEYYPEIKYDKESIDKLNKDIYPLIKEPRLTLLLRIKKKLIKSLLKV